MFFASDYRRDLFVYCVATFLFSLLSLFSIYKVQAAVTIVDLNSAIVSEVAAGYPEYIATDADGNVYVSITGVGDVKKFNSEGDLLLTIGQYGTGDGEFDSPAGLAVDSNGNIFVADKSLNRVQKFDSDGNFVVKWGSVGTGDGEFASSGSMGGIAVDSSGNVYVVDSYNDRVQKFDNDGNFITKWGSNGSGDTEFFFYSPSDIVIDSSDNVFIADSGNDRVKKYTQDGVYITSFGSSGSGDGQFSIPIGLSVDPDGNIYVADYDNSRVQIFDSSLNFVEAFGSFGSGPGEFSNAIDVLYGPLNNLIYVLDYDGRIQFFDGGSYSPPDAITTPTPTPTDSPTPIPTSSSSSENSESNSSKTSGNCSAVAPPSAPEIFDALREKGTTDAVTLWFTPVNDGTDGYTIMYGHSPGDERFSTSFSNSNSSGALSYKIEGLQLNQSYTFWVLARNGCASGPRSNYFTAAPNSDTFSVSSANFDSATGSDSELLTAPENLSPIVSRSSSIVKPDSELTNTIITIVSATGKPVANAKVSLFEATAFEPDYKKLTKVLGITNDLGQIETELPSGDYEIEVSTSKENMLTKISISSDNSSVTIKMIPNNLVEKVLVIIKDYLFALLTAFFSLVLLFMYRKL